MWSRFGGPGASIAHILGRPVEPCSTADLACAFARLGVSLRTWGLPARYLILRHERDGTVYYEVYVPCPRRRSRGARRRRHQAALGQDSDMVFVRLRSPPSCRRTGVSKKEGPMNVSLKFLTAVTAISIAAGCAPRMTVGEFVNARLSRDSRLNAMLEAADAADKAYNLVADTPIQEIETKPERIQDLVNKAHDSWRRAASYRSNTSSALQVESVKLTDLGTPDANRVPVVQREGIVFRVQATRYKVVVLGIETSRGVPMLNFDTAMNPTVEAEFQPYLRGDHVNIGGALLGQLKRDRTFVKRDGSTQSEKPGQPDKATQDARAADPQTTQQTGAGCTKDTDCKGDRICTQGSCTAPAK